MKTDEGSKEKIARAHVRLVFSRTQPQTPTAKKIILGYKTGQEMSGKGCLAWEGESVSGAKCD